MAGVNPQSTEENALSRDPATTFACVIAP
jgi:hypothetical protein